MTDAIISKPDTIVAAPSEKTLPRFSSRAATLADVDLVHSELMAVIDESPHYNELFKAHEKARLTKNFLKSLIKADPWHVMLLLSEGQIGGALVSGPEYGAIFRYWSWIFPAFRQTRLGMHGMRAFDEHWDNSRFHKAYTFVRPENEVALALLRRYGYVETCVLKNHIFGQDYVVVEKPYTKTIPGYDAGLSMGRLARALSTISVWLGR